MEVLPFIHGRHRVTTLGIGKLIKCRLTSKPVQIVSVQGSWVGLLDIRSNSLAYVSTHKVYKSYVEG